MNNKQKNKCSIKVLTNYLPINNNINNNSSNQEILGVIHML